MSALSCTLIGEFIDAVVDEPERASQLLRQHPQLLNARWMHDESVLHFLAVEGFADGVEFLAKCGADVNAVNEFGDSPLVDVAVLGNHRIAEVLLRHGANPNATSTAWDNVLHAAVHSGNADLVDLLLRFGSDGCYLTDLGQCWFDILPESSEQRQQIVGVFAKYGISLD